MNGRLYRSRDDRVISGVAAGLADQLGLDPSLVRVAWVILAIVSGGLLALVYLVMMLVVPEEPDGVTAWTGRSGGEPEADAPSATPPSSATPPPSATSATGERPTETIPPPGWRDSRRDERDRRRDDRAARRDARRAARRDSNTGPVVLGILLVVAGAWLLARRYLPAVDFDRLWPIGLVVAGIVLLVLAIRPGAREP
jgi:phage shock protein PspC (stress-responsive transcriptional regulator)